MRDCSPSTAEYRVGLPAAVAVLVLSMVAMPCMGSTREPAYRALYVFGDSYSDIGARYVDGNGPTAVAYLAQRMGIRMTYPQDPHARNQSLDFAASGAPTGREPRPVVVHAGVTWCCQGMRDQVDDFLTRLHSGTLTFEPDTTLFFSSQRSVLGTTNLSSRGRELWSVPPDRANVPSSVPAASAIAHLTRAGHALCSERRSRGVRLANLATVI